MKYRILRQVGRRGLLTPTFLPRSELLFCLPRGLSDVAAGSSLTQEMRVVAALALEGPADARRQCLLRGSPLGARVSLGCGDTQSQQQARSRRDGPVGILLAPRGCALSSGASGV